MSVTTHHGSGGLMASETRRLRLSPPVAPSDPSRDLADICDVFGLAPTSGLLSRITATPQKTLHRAASGSAIRRRKHLEIVAEFARQVREVMFADPMWTDERRSAMRNWLDNGEIEFEGQVHRPVDVLSDEELARRALIELASATQ